MRGGSESLCLSRPPRFVSGQSQKWGQLPSPPGVGGGRRFVDTLGSVNNRSTADRFFAFSGHIPQASLGLTSSPSSPGKTLSINIRTEQERRSSFQLLSSPACSPTHTTHSRNLLICSSSPPSPVYDSF